MKAYEFYVLLGKYKRKSISMSEYEKFRQQIDVNRRFRYAFRDSTGEHKPSKPETTSERLKHKRESLSPKHIQDQKNHSAGFASNEKGSEPHQLDSQASVEQPSSVKQRVSKPSIAVEPLGERNFKKVRGSNRNRKYRWLRLLRDVMKNHPIVTMAMLTLCLAMIVFVIMSPVGRNGKSTNIKNSRYGTRDHVESLNKPSHQSALLGEGKHVSLAEGKVMSEADKLLQVDHSSFVESTKTDDSGSDVDP